MEKVHFKELYNKLIARYNKADIYFKTASAEDCEKFLPSLYDLIIQLSRMMGIYEKDNGIKMTTEQVMEGFK